MIKINLLPRIINQKAIVRNTAILFGALLLVILAAGIGYSMKLAKQVADEQTLADQTKQYETKVKAIIASKESVVQSIGPIKQKSDFITGVLQYNNEYPDLYDKVTRWIYEKVVLTAMACDGTQVTLQARVKSLDDLGRFLLNLYQSTDLFTEIKVAQASGFGTAATSNMPMTMQAPSDFIGSEIGGSNAPLAGIQAISGSLSRIPPPGTNEIGVTVICKLRKPIAAPQYAGAQTQTAQPGQPMPAGPMEPGMNPGGPVPGGPGGQAAPGPAGPTGPESEMNMSGGGGRGLPD